MEMRNNKLAEMCQCRHWWTDNGPDLSLFLLRCSCLIKSESTLLIDKKINMILHKKCPKCTDFPCLLCFNKNCSRLCQKKIKNFIENVPIPSNNIILSRAQARLSAGLIIRIRGYNIKCILHVEKDDREGMIEDDGGSEDSREHECCMSVALSKVWKWEMRNWKVGRAVQTTFCQRIQDYDLKIWKGNHFPFMLNL